MKNLFIILLAMACVTFQAKADVYVTNNMAVGISTPASVPVQLTRLTLFTTNLTATIVYLYDGFLTQTNNGYTNYVTSTTSQITLYTNTTGLTNTWTNTVITTSPNAVAARVNVLSTPLATLVVPPSPGVLDVNSSLLFGNRITLSNTAQGLSAVISYRLR